MCNVLCICLMLNNLRFIEVSILAAQQTMVDKQVVQGMGFLRLERDLGVGSDNLSGT